MSRGSKVQVKYDVFDVFTPTTQATLNFVERPSINDQLVDALQTPGKQIVVYGETGSGKSTLLQNKLHQLYEGHIVTQCHSMMTFEQILLDAFDQLAPFYQDTAARTLTKDRSASLGAEFLTIRASLDASHKRSEQDTERRALPPQLTPQRLGEFLGARGLCWVIEDFHKVKPAEKKQLAQSLKVFCDLAREFKSVKIIAIGATGTAREVIEYDPEMSNRVSEILVPLMTDEETASIISGGERLLNVDFGSTKDLIVAYSVGVASICHQLALNCCLEQNVKVRRPEGYHIDATDLQSALSKYIRDSSDTLKSRFERALLRRQVKKYDNCRLILRALANGPIEGMLFNQLITAIRVDHPQYPAGNLTNYLKVLQNDERGGLIRSDGTGHYCFIDPFYHLFAHLTLANEGAGRALSDVNLIAELQKEVADTVLTLMNRSLSNGRYQRNAGRQLTLWTDTVAERLDSIPHRLYHRPQP